MNADFREVWCVDFEYSQSEGEQPKPICMVARELLSGRETRLRQPELRKVSTQPYIFDEEALFVAYGAVAELRCHLALNWQLPIAILDLHAEFRVLTNGRVDAQGASLLAACRYYGVATLDEGAKQHMHALAIRGGHFTEQELEMLEAYCASDVDALASLFRVMYSSIDLPRALIRGRYLRALSQVEARGLPIDTVALNSFRDHWPELQEMLIRTLDAPTGVYRDHSFSSAEFGRWLAQKLICWPRAASGKLKLDDETFKAMSLTHPDIAQLRELRKTLSTMRRFDMVAGEDGRSRASLKPWQARTGRNQPSTTRFVFGLPIWMRGFLRPQPGRALSYVDWSQQEFGIAAALSEDDRMLEAYTSGDPYLAFAKQAGVVPNRATKESHPCERDRFKACTLAVQYGMGEDSLAARIGQSPAHAACLLRHHKNTYRTFWSWSDRVWETALCQRKLSASFGWAIHYTGPMNERSVRNFPMQANGSEMMRIACFLAVEAGVQVCATVHDAFVIEAAACEIEEAERIMQNCMAEASHLVLDGFCLRSDAKRVEYPERFSEQKGQRMWQQVNDLLRSVCAGSQDEM